ncbi:MAG: hypothetical protein M3O46_19435 [Myxococcota bacterium]|nr:hypothetical protein [Myxococcota bacterium]
MRLRLRLRWRTWGVAAAAWTVASSSSTSRADDSATAQALFDLGKKAMAAHNYAEACPKFEESVRLQPALGALLNLADCYEREGKLTTAWSRFLELASKARAAGQSERAEIGRKRAAALAPRLSNIVINVGAAEKTPGLEVKRDGTVIGQAEWGTPIPADPGAHTLEASAPGRQPWSTTVKVEEGAKTSTVSVPELAPVHVESKAPAPILTTSPLPSPPPGSDTAGSNGGFGAQRVLALISGGVGLAGIGVGSYFGFQSHEKHDAAMIACPDRLCPTPDGVNLWNAANIAGDRSTVAFIVGAAGLAGAGVLWFTAPSGTVPRTQVGVGPGMIRVNGVW